MTTPQPHDQANCPHPDCQFESELGYNPADPLGKGDSNVEQPMSVQSNDRPDVQLPVAGTSGALDVPVLVSYSARITELEGQVCRWTDAYADVAADLTEARRKNERLQEVAKAAEDLLRFLPGPDSPNIPLANLRDALAKLR